ncbi:MAG: dihydrofolate reductase, partial [Duncaniella sp.]|nr:dihydrofolate reductase [Duncaniella sp.]
MQLSRLFIPAAAAAGLMFSSCGGGKEASADTADNFDYNVDRFADIEVLAYKVPDFEKLTPRQRILIYYLTEAALTGRDILWDQNGRFNLAIRDLIENVYAAYDGDKNSDDYKGLELYLKQIEFANGIHHHYSMDKFQP